MSALVRIPVRRSYPDRLTPRWLVAVILLIVQNSLLVSTARADATAVSAGYGLEYAVPGAPHNLAVEAPGRLWFVSPQANGLGLLIITSPPDAPVVRYRTEFIGLAPNTEPYDLVVDEGIVWFTLRGSGQIGRLDAATRELELITIPTAGSRPTGIDVDPEGQVWFADSVGQLGKLNPADGTLTLYPFPPGLYPPSYVEDLRVQDRRNIWFTFPDGHTVGNFKPLTPKFFSVPTIELGNSASESALVLGPMRLEMNSDGPWVTAAGSSKVGKFAPNTLAQWFWYDTPTPDSGPSGIVTFFAGGVREVWFAQSKVGAVARLQLVNGFDILRQEELPLAAGSSRPAAIAVDADRHLWIADTARNVIYELRPPYIYRHYFPAIYP